MKRNISRPGIDNDPPLQWPKTRKLERILIGVRQLQYKKPFRIAAPVCSAEFLAALSVELGAAKASSAPAEDIEPFHRLISDVGTGLWRARRRMSSKAGTELSGDMRVAHRHVESTWDALVGGQVKIVDPTGEKYVTGMALRVITFQPTPGLTQETIVETIEPSIFYKGKLIQRGEVIVGTPMDSDTKGLAEIQRDPAQASRAENVDENQAAPPPKADAGGESGTERSAQCEE